ncbi:MAG: hypothetical protein ICV73_30580 [Acetobacteraceae bacterium]|nr:hypothetical protein [Acetobacteraceae bacterium]
MAAQMLSATAVAKSITVTRPDPKDRFPPILLKKLERRSGGHETKEPARSIALPLRAEGFARSIIAPRRSFPVSGRLSQRNPPKAAVDA